MDRNRNISAQLLFSIIIWVLIVLLPFVFFPYNRDFSPLHSSRFVSWSVFSVVYLLLFYYANGYYFIPSFLAKKRIALYTFITLFCFLLYLFLFNQISMRSEETLRFIAEHKREGNFRRIPRSVYFFGSAPITLFLFAWIGSSTSTIVSRWFNAEKVKEQVYKQQLETELNLLKSQVNPHFLFNTLNSIYTLAVTNSPKTSDAVMKLSRIMRYTLEESKNDRVQLLQEVEFINSYIDLQKMRLTSNVKVSFDVKGATDFVSIPPLLFIPFIENAFKYGVSTHHPSTIDARIEIADGQLLFSCSNAVFAGSAKMESTGTGIDNARRRLDLLFGSGYRLDIDDSSERFTVALSFPLLPEVKK